MLVKLLQGLYHGFRCLLGVHHWKPDVVNAKYDRCYYCNVRTRRV